MGCTIELILTITAIDTSIYIVKSAIESTRCISSELSSRYILITSQLPAENETFIFFQHCYSIAFNMIICDIYINRKATHFCIFLASCSIRISVEVLEESNLTVLLAITTIGN